MVKSSKKCAHFDWSNQVHVVVFITYCKRNEKLLPHATLSYKHLRIFKNTLEVR